MGSPADLEKVLKHIEGQRFSHKYLRIALGRKRPPDPGIPGAGAGTLHC